MKLTEKFPQYFLLLIGVYFAMLFATLGILIAPGLSLGINRYTEFWLLAVIPFLPLISLSFYIKNRDPTNAAKIRWTTIILISITAFEFLVLVFPLALP